MRLRAGAGSRPHARVPRRSRAAREPRSWGRGLGRLLSAVRAPGVRHAPVHRRGASLHLLEGKPLSGVESETVNGDRCSLRTGRLTDNAEPPRSARNSQGDLPRCDVVIARPPRAHLGVACSRPWSRRRTCTRRSRSVTRRGVRWDALGSASRRWCWALPSAASTSASPCPLARRARCACGRLLSPLRGRAGGRARIGETPQSAPHVQTALALVDRSSRDVVTLTNRWAIGTARRRRRSRRRSDRLRACAH